MLSSAWGRTQAILAINILSGVLQQVNPGNSSLSWDLLTVDRDNIIAECNSPVDAPKIKYGVKASIGDTWSWQDVPNPIFKCSEKVKSLISTHQCRIIKVPVKDGPDCSSEEGTYRPINCNHSWRSSLCLLVYILQVVCVPFFDRVHLADCELQRVTWIWRGSFAVHPRENWFPDVLTAIDYVIDTGLANPSKIAVTDKFIAAVPRNPVYNFALMVGTCDIPDWCYVESFGCEAKSYFTEAPPVEHLVHFYEKSPISLIHKVKTPTFFLLGAKDLRVPVSNDLQYARALREKVSK